MYGATVAAILVTMGLALSRAAAGPTVFDRILALNMFGTKTVLLIAVIGFLTHRPDFLDHYHSGDHCSRLVSLNNPQTPVHRPYPWIFN